MVEDVVNEAIANALSDGYEKPERMKLEPWIHRLAAQAIDHLSSNGHDEGNIPLERSHGEQNVRGTDEALLQFHQPDEKLYEESVIADPAANNPEELAARRELIGLVETTLRDAGRNEREAFIFYTIEGFTLDEIADITNHTVEEVRAAITPGARASATRLTNERSTQGSARGVFQERLPGAGLSHRSTTDRTGESE